MLIMLPWATPIALGTIGWLWLLDSKFSPIDWVLQAVHLLGPGTLLGPGNHMIFLGREGLAMASVIMVYVWRMLPLSAVILLAGLSSIDQDILDQAAVDGAGFWRTLFRIKLPLILPIMSIVLLFGMIFTAIVQSSSITTSLIIPLAAAGILTIRQIYPYTLGANLGTTITAILASLSTGNIGAVTIGFSHLLFNIFGIAIFTPLKGVPVYLAEKFSQTVKKSIAIPIIFIIISFFVIPIFLIYIL